MLFILFLLLTFLYKKKKVSHDLSGRDFLKLASGFLKYIVVYLLLQRLLFFLHRPVGMPKMEKVYLHNPSSEEISLISISATTAHFHASFFQNRVSVPLIFTHMAVCLYHVIKSSYTFIKVGLKTHLWMLFLSNTLRNTQCAFHLSRRWHLLSSFSKIGYSKTIQASTEKQENKSM